MKPGIKKALSRALLLVAGLVLAFLLLEILCRIFWEEWSGLEQESSISFVAREDYRKPPRPAVFWPGQLGNVKEFSVHTVKNYLGFHDGEHEPRKPGGTFRIVVLGDSFVEALQVPLEKAFHKVLEAELNEKLSFPVEVISLGKSGAGTEKSLELLTACGLSFQPDLVILEFLSNDLIDNTPALRKEEREQEKRRKQFVPELKDIYPRFLLIPSSRFNQLLALKLSRVLQGIKASANATRDKYGFVHLNTLVFAEEYAPLWEKAWRRTERFILRCGEESEAADARFCVIAFPEMWRVGPRKELRKRMKTMSKAARDLHWDFEKTDRTLREFCKEKGIAFHSLLPAFREARERTGKNLHYPYDMHLNERGHRVAAEDTAAFLLARRLVPN